MTSSSVSTPVDSNWWRGAVIYQVYPRSYQDSNYDGVGDLRGITARLDHIAALGADAVWISPFYKSPMKDFGYDVEDYRDVDPLFGSLTDFKALIWRAHELGLKIMIDLVMSHTSDTHAWFAESSVSRENDKSDWYVWADAQPDGSPPNNWLSIFGGSAWQWNGKRMQYYLHNFLVSQPDLNFHCPAVQDALLDMVRFWLDLGVDGFRLDTINFYVHDRQLRSNPALPVEQRNASIAPAVNPYNWQEHLYDKNQPENLNFLERFRALLDEYPAATAVGEIGDAQFGMQLLRDYTSGQNRVHMCYTFEMLSPNLPTADYLHSVITQFLQDAPEAWICWAFSNHDVIRHASRWEGLLGRDTDALLLYASLLLSLRGSVCLYQGEELGLPEAEVPYEHLQDPYGIEFWPEFKGRDGCRTPMPWRMANEPHAGFTTGEPWLPIPEEHRALAVAEQQGVPDSTLSGYQRLLALRKAHPALIDGTIDEVAVHGEVLQFRRSNHSGALLCVFNLSNEPAQLSVTGVAAEPVWAGNGVSLSAGQLNLPPRTSAWLTWDTA